jgi:hypothetical protein
LEAPVETWFKPIAYALILLRKMATLVFSIPIYTEQITKTTEKMATNMKFSFDKVDAIEELIKARKDFAYGEQRDYFDDAHCIGWTREGDDEHSGCAVVLSNKDGNQKSMEIGKRYAGKRFMISRDILRIKLQLMKMAGQISLSCGECECLGGGIEFRHKIKILSIFERIFDHIIDAN